MLETVTTRFLENTLARMKVELPATHHDWQATWSDGKSTTYSTAPEWGRMMIPLRDAGFFDDIEKALLELPEFRSFLDAGQMAGIYVARLEAIPEHLLLAYLSQASSLSFDAAVAREIAANFADAVRRQVRADIKIAALEGFRCDVDSVECIRGWRIRSIDPTAYTQLFTPTAAAAMVGGFCTWPFVLERLEEVSFSAGPQVIYAYDETIDLIVQALRVLYPERVMAGRMLSRAARPGAVGMSSGTMLGWSGTPKVQPFDTSCCLRTEDIPAFQKILGRISKSEFGKSTGIAIGRVTSASNRSSPEDAFIDYVVALEALFGDNSDGLPGGLTYKIALRAAVFTETEKATRRAVVQGLKKALRLRGALVHGAASMSVADEDQKRTLDFVAVTARKALRTILVDLPSPRDFREGFVDDLILDGALSASS